MLFCLKKHGIIYNFVFFSNIKLINLCAFVNCMKVKCSSAVDSFKGLVVAGVFSGNFESLRHLDKEFGGSIKDLFDSKVFEGEYGQYRLISSRENSKENTNSLLLFGLGKKEDASVDLLRKAAGS